MAARKKTTRRRTTKKRATRGKSAVARLEAELPKGVRAYTKEVRKRLNVVEKNVGKVRAQASRRGTALLREASEYIGRIEARGEREFRKRRREAARLLERLGKAVAPTAKRKRSTRKRATRKK